jgi:hypothetical protein
MILEYVIIGILSTLVIVLGIGVRNLLKQNEQLEDDLVNYITGMRNLSFRTLESMREIDSRGAFESDDEVGSVFSDLKTVVEHLNERIEEIDVRAETKKD